MAREVPIGVVLSVTNERLTCDMSDLHEFLEYMAGEAVWTHQLGRVADESRRPLLRRYPWLSEIDTPKLSTKQEYVDWLAELPYHQSLVVEPLSFEEHASIDPLDELLGMRER